MAILTFTGFEAGNFASEDIGAPAAGTIVTTNVRPGSGAYAMRMNPSASTSVCILKKAAANGNLNSANFVLTSCYCGLYVFIGSLPAADYPVLGIANSSGAVIGVLFIKPDGSLYASNNAGSNSATIATLGAGQGYYLELKCQSASTGEGRVNGGTAQTFTCASGQIDMTFIGSALTNHTVDLTLDDWYVDDAGYRYPGAYVRAHLPNRAGSSAAWASGTGATFAEVDELPQDGDTTYIKSIASADASTFGMEASKAGGNILATKTTATCRDEGAASSVIVRCKSGATNGDTTGQDPGASYKGKGRYDATDPATGAAWTVVGFNGVECGVVNNAAAAMRCTNIIIQTIDDGAVLGRGQAANATRHVDRTRPPIAHVGL